MSNTIKSTNPSRFSEYSLNNYSAYKAAACKTSPSANRVVAVMQRTVYKVAALVSLTFSFLSNVVLSIANLAIRAANFTHGRIFTKEAPAAKPTIETKPEPANNVSQITYVETAKDSGQVAPAAAKENADQETPTVDTAPGEEAPVIVDPKKDKEASTPSAKSPLEKEKKLNFSDATLNALKGFDIPVLMGVGCVGSSIATKALGLSVLRGVSLAAQATVFGVGTSLIIGKAVPFLLERILKNKKEAPVIVDTKKDGETSSPPARSPLNKEENLNFSGAILNPLKGYNIPRIAGIGVTASSVATDALGLSALTTVSIAAQAIVCSIGTGLILDKVAPLFQEHIATRLRF